MERRESPEKELRVVERRGVIKESPEKELRVEIPNIYVPKWVLREVGFKPGDTPDWTVEAIDIAEKGEKPDIRLTGCLRRLVKPKYIIDGEVKEVRE